MRNMQAIQREAQKLYKKYHNLRAASAKMGVSYGTFSRLLKGIEPKDLHIRTILDLPLLIPAPACRRCGEVHTTRRCTKNRRPRNNWRYLFGMTMDELERRLNLWT